MTELNQAERAVSSSMGGAPDGGWNALVPELDVFDLNASLRFWCELLGFEIAYDRPAARFAYLQREGAQVMLCQVNGNWTTGPLDRPLGRGINLQVMTQELESSLKALAEAEWPLHREPYEVTYRLGNQEGRSREFLVQDPDGYLIRMAQSLGRKPMTP